MATNQTLKQELTEKQFFKNWDRSLESLKAQVEIYTSQNKPVPLWLDIAHERKELENVSRGSGPDLEKLIQAINDDFIINLSAHHKKYGKRLLENSGKHLLNMLVYEAHARIGNVVENPEGYLPSPTDLRQFKHDITVQILVNGDDVERSRLSGLLKAGYLPEDISNEIVSYLLEDWLCGKHLVQETISALDFLVANNAIFLNSESFALPEVDPISSGTLIQAIDHAIALLRKEKVSEEMIAILIEARDRYSKMAEQ